MIDGNVAAGPTATVHSEALARRLENASADQPVARAWSEAVTSMPFAFRCTGCRAKLHVPTRWAGGTVPCPKCRTRVVVPNAPEAAAPGSSPGNPAAVPATRFESRSLERSLAALEPAPGGSFADSDFELPPGGPEIIAEATDLGVTLPWWVIYAAAFGFAVVAAGSFLAGMWWAAPAVK
jgi:hypothetical protein